MREAGLAVELLETRHVRDAFKTMAVKSDRKDARGIAQLMRLGWFRPVHCKSMEAQETRAMLTARKLVQSKLHDVEMSLRGYAAGLWAEGREDHANAVCRSDQGAGRRPTRPCRSSPRRCWRCMRCCCASSRALEKRVRMMARCERRRPGC